MSAKLLKSHTLERVTGVKHCFTTRQGGFSEGHLSSLNIGRTRGDCPETIQKNYDTIAKQMGFDTDKLRLTSQVHGDVVLKVAEGYGLFNQPNIDCDALITDVAGISLVVYTADCVPILLCDPQRRCIAAIHAGWRGTSVNIVHKTIDRLYQEYGSSPENIVAAIGPAIGRCCYEVGEEVVSALSGLYPQAGDTMSRTDSKWHADLKDMNRALMVQAGVLPQNISVDGHCTRCNPELFWSHRRHGDRRGLQGAIITLES